MSVPDDASSLLGEVAFALVLTPVAGAEALAATCAIAKIAADVVPSPVGALAVCRVTSSDAPAAAAGALSRLLRGVPLVLIERREGQLSASRWLDGDRGDDLAPGLVLNDAPEVLEDLVLGSTTPAELDGVVSSVGMSRLKAMRVLAAAARAARQ
ncbi:hypothetical protein [Pengzhenrongella frigida]|uniref:Uncharacterized protein n=1 Tax=Pengzhenrongella frigida TaxID=1259133 RepID=A0A4Q5N6F2_9MICO|nr:hypothetical protein [Cellulomonas sp. HLT2-17]RYV52507.1 hypothetical protein EUA98_03355 [Cellulomonas sp. HLT2-17]